MLRKATPRMVSRYRAIKRQQSIRRIRFALEDIRRKAFDNPCPGNKAWSGIADKYEAHHKGKPKSLTTETVENLECIAKDLMN